MINPTIDSPMLISAAFKNKLKITNDHSSQHSEYVCDVNDDININISVNEDMDIIDTMIKISALGGQSKGWSFEQKQQVIRYHDYIVTGHSYFGKLSYQ